MFPWSAHTVHRHPMSSISIRIFSHLSRTRALTQPPLTHTIAVASTALEAVEAVVRRGQRGRSATRNKGEPAYQCHTLGLARGSAPSNPDRGEFPLPPITPAGRFSLSREL